MRIERGAAAALIIDIQERLFPHIAEAERLKERVTLLIRGLQALKTPLLLTEQYPQGLGRTLPDLAALLQTEPIEKNSFSCWDQPVCRGALTQLQRSTIVIAGIEAHVCVQQTVLDLLSAQLVPVVVVDCISSRRPSDKDAALWRMRTAGALLTTSEALLFELCRYANIPDFKPLAALIKETPL